MNLLNSLLSSDAYTPVNKHIAKYLGFNVAGYFGEMIRQRARFGQEEFYFSQDNMYDEIGMSPIQQRGCLDKLKNEGRISIQKKGLPYKNYYIIHDNVVLDFLSKTEQQVSIKQNKWLAENKVSSSEETSQLVVMKPHNKIVENLTTSSEETSHQVVRKPHNIIINNNNNNNKNNNKKENNKDPFENFENSSENSFENSFENHSSSENYFEKEKSTPLPPSKNKIKISKYNKDSAILIYNKIKEYSPIVDGKLEDCVYLHSKLKQLGDPVQTLNNIILGMMKTGIDKYYTISNPSRIANNLGTIITKLRSEINNQGPERGIYEY